MTGVIPIQRHHLDGAYVAPAPATVLGGDTAAPRLCPDYGGDVGGFPSPREAPSLMLLWLCAHPVPSPVPTFQRLGAWYMKLQQQEPHPLGKLEVMSQGHMTQSTLHTWS